MKFEEFLTRFTVDHRSGKSAQCRCPAHDDRKASLTITEADDGNILLHCHANCTPEAVTAAVGLKLSDLFNGDQPVSRWRSYVEGREKKKIEGEYPYYDLQGQYVFTRLRLTGKKFIYGTLADDRWSYGLNGKKRKDIPAIFTVGFRRLTDAIRRGDRIFYVEGEKDVLRLNSEGLTGITCGACGDWHPAVADLLTAAEVIVIADNDQPGMKSARQVVRDLTGKAQSVKMITVTDIEGGDVSDFFDAGHTVEDLNRLILNSVNMNSEFMNLDQFHLFDERGKIKGVYDYAIFKHLTEQYNIFVLGGVPFIYDGGCYRMDGNGAKLKTLIRSCCYPEFIKSTTIKRVYDLFITAQELQVTYDQLNQYPAHWINFRNGFFDPVTGQLKDHDPEYKAVNQVPHVYDPEAEVSGQAVEDWLRFAVADPDDREMLLQYAGYCLTRDTRQQKFLILNGEGGTGKSTVIRMIEAMIGSENISNISLSELTQRFASYGLLGKLLNSCADLEVQALEDTSTLKKVLGEDTLRGEAKGKDSFSFKSYAKLIFSTNELPVIKAEKTNGFYRRLLILPMNRVPEVARSDFYDQLSAEIGYFIRISVQALSRMYKRGTLAESRHSAEAVDRLRMDSDTVEAFLNDKCERVRGERVERGYLYQMYSDYCYESDRTSLTRNNFFRSLRIKGFPEIRSASGRYFCDIFFGKTVTKTVTESGFTQVDIDLPFMKD